MTIAIQGISIIRPRIAVGSRDAETGEEVAPAVGVPGQLSLGQVGMGQLDPRATCDGPSGADLSPVMT